MASTPHQAPEHLNVSDVAAAVAQVAAEADDNEQAHAIEDGLRASVLRAIAAGAPSPAELAAEALKTTAIEFERWYA